MELRLLIWEHCLPHRVAEEDECDFLLDGHNSRQACYAKRTTYLNTRLPVIAFVNSESRKVALEQGRWWKPGLGIRTELGSLWVQPRRDGVHTNWQRLRYIDVGYNEFEKCSPLYMFLHYADELGVQPSVVAEAIHPFNMQALLDGADGADASDSPCFLDKQNERYFDLNWMVTFAMHGTDNHIRLDVAMAAVSLHIPRESALSSGLFGLLGDAPVQLVDVGDEARLREFQILFSEHALEKEPAVQTLFEAFTSSRFKTAVETWRRQAEWLILAYIWDRAVYDKLDLLEKDSGSAWIPRLPELKYLRMSDYLPKENHPWVKQARQIMPKLRPRIMVRYCTNECYIKERLPEDFGEIQYIAL